MPERKRGKEKKILELASPPQFLLSKHPLGNKKKKKEKKRASVQTVAAFPIVSSSTFITSYPRYKKKFHFHYFIDRVTKGYELFFLYWVFAWKFLGRLDRDRT